MEIVIVLFVLIVVTWAIVSAWLAAKRRKELAAWADGQGLRFSPTKDWGADARFPDFRHLQQGSNRYAYNITTGIWAGYPLVAFDYHYETRSTGSKGRRQTHHHYFSAVILGATVPLKPLFIRAEGFLDKVAEFVGFDDIDFESAEFSRRFYVTAQDRRWAYDVLHARTIEFLLDSPRFTLEFGRAGGMAYRSSTFRVEEFEQAAEVLRGVLDRLPDYLVNQLKEGGP